MLFVTEELRDLERDDQLAKMTDLLYLTWDKLPIIQHSEGSHG